MSKENLENRVEESKLGKAKKILTGAASKIGRGIAGPMLYLPLEQHLALTYQDPRVKGIISSAQPEQQQALVERLAYHLRNERAINRDLKASGGFVDTADRVLYIPGIIKKIPIAGYLLSLSKKMALMPAKMLNSLYYTARTGEYATPIRDASREVVASIPFGHEEKRIYTNRVDIYVAKKAADNFLKELKTEKEVAERRKRIVDIGEELRGKKKEEYAQAA